MFCVCARTTTSPFLAAACLAVLSGCAILTPPLTQSSRTGANCVDDSAQCLAERRTALNAIMNDKSASWVNQQPTATTDASGVRLFAFKQRKRHLNCAQLRSGYREASTARQRLRSSNNPALTPALISRGAILGDEVARELKREMKRRRCKSA